MENKISNLEKQELDLAAIKSSILSITNLANECENLGAELLVRLYGISQVNSDEEEEEDAEFHHVGDIAKINQAIKILRKSINKNCDNLLALGRL